MRFHKLQNVQIALDFLRHRQVRRRYKVTVCLVYSDLTAAQAAANCIKMQL